MTSGSWPAVPQVNPLVANRYRKGRSLGTGGFGEVFYAEDIKFNPPRPVAIKIVHPDLLVDPQVRDGISKEANVLAQFKHPNILRVLDFEVERDRAYIVTELAEGGSAEVREAIRERNKGLVDRYADILKTEIGDEIVDVDPLFLHVAILGVCEFFTAAQSIILPLAEPETDPAELADRYEAFVIDLFLNGLRRR